MISGDYISPGEAGSKIGDSTDSRYFDKFRLLKILERKEVIGVSVYVIEDPGLPGKHDVIFSAVGLDGMEIAAFSNDGHQRNINLLNRGVPCPPCCKRRG